MVVRERRGDFYDVYDTAAFGPRWLTAQEVAREASGCVLVSDAVPPTPGVQLTPQSVAAAATYRGRCHGPLPWDHDDSPDDCGGSGGDGNGDGLWAGGSQLPNGDGVWSGGTPPPSGCNCNGAPRYFVSEPWLNLWLLDTPLHYKSAYGPDVSLELAYKFRHTTSPVSGFNWQGARFGNYDGSVGNWYCSLLSFAELDSGENTVELELPGDNWAAFTFSAGSSLSDVNYRHNLTLQKQGPSGGVTNLMLRYPNGSSATYSIRDTNAPGYASYACLFYISAWADPAGNQTTFRYDQNFYLTCYELF